MKETQTLIQIMKENIYVEIISYSCFWSHDKRQETQQLEETYKIMSFHESFKTWLHSAVQEREGAVLHKKRFPNQMTHS